MKFNAWLLFSLSLLTWCIANAQSSADILNNVDTVWSGGAPGGLTATDPQATALVSSRPCHDPLLHFCIANGLGSGRVVVLGHEAILSDNSIVRYDNQTFLLNAIDWITPGSNKRVSLRPGWINMGNSTVLQAQLQAKGYTFGALSGPINAAALSNTDVLILGNDWNGQVDYTTAEVDAIEDFVLQGGGLLVAGLGWSFPQGLNNYPMNTVAQRFGIAYNTSIIRDPIYRFNNSPLLYNFHPDNLDTAGQYCPSPYFGRNLTRGDTLRVLRLAVSTNGEFATQNGGVNVVSGLIDTWLATINETYGREFCVRFELIPNNDLLIFPDASTDPWQTLPIGSGGCTNANLILSDQARVIDSIIGAANYDLSHVIVGSPFGGGCAGSFKTGVSGGLNIPVTRHELGHQFGQSHTINNSGQNNYEPENGGWSLHGGNQHGHAHGVTFHQLALNLTGINASAGTKVPTGNSPPQVQLRSDVAIPVNTPFTLTATASDSDPGDSLTYVWDNMSPGIAQSIPVQDDTQGALFWRLLPSPENSRTFPRMADVLANVNANNQEQLPTQPRIMDIRVTVNDNHRMMYQGESISASGVASADIRLTVAEAGPFEVTSQAQAGLVYDGLSNQQITWAVNGTDTMPINTQFVDILLSDDGGNTFPYLLAGQVPNDGLTIVQMPNINTTEARIKIAAVDNIYFDVNLQEFEIQAIPSSVNALALQRISIFPNPAHDRLFVEGVPDGDHVLSLFDLQGRLVQQVFNTRMMDISQVAAGLYVVEVAFGQQRLKRKLVIE